jgi:hypothetical protein
MNTKVYQMVIKYPKYSRWPQNISTFSNLRHFKIYPNWDFGLKIKHLATLDSDLRVYSAPPDCFLFSDDRLCLDGLDTQNVIHLWAENRGRENLDPVYSSSFSVTMANREWAPGLPDGIPKFPIGENFGRSCVGKCWCILRPFGVFYGHLVYFTAIWCILRSRGMFCGHLVHFSRFGKL